MNWVPFELHTHTPHSDGRHSLLEMCREAKKLGLGGIALTDHNTVSGLAEAKAALEETGVAVIPGMEWTTFYGHMLTLGAPYCEWRDLGPRDIHKGIGRVHEAGGIVGIAHPYSLGSPICTGCHWEYEIKDWNDIDYIEVWHEMMPPYKNHNVPALQQWTALLNEGYRIAATAGRDWHHSDHVEGWSAFTYVGLADEKDRFSAESVVKAIQSGRCIVSMGPLLHVEASVGAASYGIGDDIDAADVGESREGKDGETSMSLRIHVEPSAEPGRFGDEVQVTKLIIESNVGELAVLPWTDQQSAAEHHLQTEGLRWLRVKAMGVLYGGFTTIAFTNPIYFVSR
ncbi:CehA/McbA family metallohydrolase [Paenibacillus turpanensis]|uniref:CehA/McbA family metallohydrolase n=1 Tax=Paenibacillus turpanensis TaxID=2689078 RepID=UPI00140E3141|nr:CehA/McbA family metallohydrolase [Paenibacillus turpanensis]